MSGFFPQVPNHSGSLSPPQGGGGGGGRYLRHLRHSLVLCWAMRTGQWRGNESNIYRTIIRHFSHNEGYCYQAHRGFRKRDR
jgi:hypothetical protein